MKTVKILVTGSRDVHQKCKKYVFKKLDIMVTKAALREGKTLKDVLMVVGCARGIDAWVIEWAQSRKVRWKKFEAEWKRYGRAAGCIRNSEMVKLAHYCLGFWNGVSTGTADAIISSRSKRIPVKVYDVIPRDKEDD